jgi:hypothetical protein
MPIEKKRESIKKLEVARMELSRLMLDQIDKAIKTEKEK